MTGERLRIGFIPLADAVTLPREMLAAARAVWRPDLYDAILGKSAAPSPGEPADAIGAFAGPAFDPNDIAAHLAAWTIRRR